mgnify:CR=1 FL=1
MIQNHSPEQQSRLLLMLGEGEYVCPYPMLGVCISGVMVSTVTSMFTVIQSLIIIDRCSKVLSHTNSDLTMNIVLVYEG